MAEQRSYTGSFDNRWKFTGKEQDQDTGLYYFGARYYNPSTSIWLSVDPLVEQTMDAYGYCYQNPINLIDPTGMSPDDYYLNIKTGNVEHHAGSKNRTEEGLVRVAGDNATVGDIEKSLSSMGFKYEKDASAKGGFSVDTKAALQGWNMMQIYSPDNMASILGISTASGFGPDDLYVAVKAAEKICKSISKAVVKATAKEIVKNGLLNKIKSHSFSAKHIKAGVMELGSSIDDISNTTMSVISRNSSKLVEGSNDIVTKMNGHIATVRAFVKDGNVINGNVFKGTSGRNVNNLIKE